MDAVDDGYQTLRFNGGNLVFSTDRKKGYPLNVILDGLAYIIASKTGNLNGKRPRGNREEIIINALAADRSLSVTCKVPDLLTPIFITDGVVSAMIGPLNEDVYKKLISFSDDNKYKMTVRKITEADLR